MRIIAIILLVLPTACWGANFQEGLTAFSNKDYERALKEWEPLALKNDAKSLYYLGIMYNEGKGVSRNYELALELITKAATNGFIKAQKALGMFYSSGWPIVGSKNIDTAIEWYGQAAHQGDLGAYWNLYFIYTEEEHGVLNARKAAKLVSYLAKQGDAEAQLFLGYHYRDGDGVLQDYETALKWFTLAAEQGEPAGLGNMYEAGKGVPQNYIIAHMWYNIGASLGGSNLNVNTLNRDIIESKMSEDEIYSAQQLARECVSKSLKNC